MTETNRDSRSASDRLTCPACGAPVPADQRFCGQCGASLSQVCPNCQASNPLQNRFCGTCGSPLASAPPASATTAEGLAEERRWATVLFADISGFTALSESMDAEDVKNLADQCAQRVSQEVHRFGGTVIQVVGDQVYAVFGAPVAHEDDAERAVRAGLALRGLNLSDQAARPIRLHIGINTGDVMAGLVGPHSRRDYAVMGDTVNTAARLMAAAPAGTVLVGQTTYRETQRQVRYAEVAPIRAKGKDQPVAAWEAQDVVAAPRSRPLGRTALIGRDGELARLDQMWTRVRRGAQSHLVTVLGEPGIGKSRLVAEFERRLPADATVWHGRCLPYGEALGYWALAMVLKEAAGIVAEDEPEAARAKLEAMVAEVVGPEGEPGEVACHLALLGGLDVAADRRTSAGDQRLLHASARRFFEAAARRRPLCLVLDDVQWADDSMLDLIESVAARLREVPLLIVTLARPELLEKRPAWGRGVRSFTSLPMDGLSQEAERELALALCRERGLPEALADQVGHSAAGNPLFVEELVAMLAEGAAAAQVPSLIKMLIAARLDSLPAEERLALQLASIFGKVFWESGLPALDRRAAGRAAEALETLEQKDLLRAQPRSQFRGHREYTFKHDLIRDVAYDRLPKAERRALHGRAADWLERAAGEQAEAYYDQLAHHAVQAGQHERAVDFLARAAERAGRASNQRQAAALLGQAIALAEGLGKRALVADLHARRGNALVNAGLWADARPELEAALAGLPAESRVPRALVLNDLATVSFWLFDMPGLRRHASEVMTIAEAVKRDDIMAGALAAMTLAHSSDGDSQSAVALTAQSLQLAGDDPLPVVTFGAAISSLNFFWLGRFAEAALSAQQAVDIARRARNTHFTSYALPHLGLALSSQAKYAEAERVFAEAQRFSRDYENWPMLARAMLMSTAYHFDVFDYAGHETLVEEARQQALSGKILQPVVSSSIDLLFNYVHRGEVGRAEQVVSEVAETVANAAGNHGWLWRLRLAEARAELALARGDWEETLRLAEVAAAQSQAQGRVKYHGFSLTTRASALAALGRKREALAAARGAVDLIRPLDAPAYFVRVAAALLRLEGDDLIRDEARAAARRVSAALTDDVVRQRFEASEPVQVIEG